MTRFVTYDPEVAARLAQAVGVHRVELRDATQFAPKVNPALADALHSPARSAVLMSSSDEQVLLVQMNEGPRDEDMRAPKKHKKASKHPTNEEEVGTRPSGFLGLHDEAVFSGGEDEPPRSLWKKDE